ncbi:MAG: EAL domain-containing protein [Nitrospirae bacterium]|nr:EAL domain-containing protein [Nitrospirota bacterium]
MMKKKLEDINTLRKKAEEQLLHQTKKMQGISMKGIKNLAHELGTYQIELEMQNEELRRAQQELEASRSRYADLYDFAPIGYFTLDNNGLIMEANLSGAKLLGIDRRYLINKPFSAFVIRDDLSIFRTHLLETIEKKLRMTSELRIKQKNGAILFVQLQSISSNDNEDGSIFCRTATIDITERRHMEDAIRHQANHDALTNMPNRRLLMEILTVTLEQARRSQDKLAVLFLDLDRFKYINDTLGHNAGDMLLKEVVLRLQNSVRASDTISRTGGDEFNILLTKISVPDDILTIAQKVINSFSKHFMINGHELDITTSIGISIYPEDGKNIEELFKNADIAMYHAKEHGGNSYQFYNPAMNIRSVERLQLESQLSRALKRCELTVYYQPQITIDTQQIFSAEALVRWQHPEKGVIDPVHFIPLAEETGFITAIDEWVLKTACLQVNQWHNAGLKNLCVAVNLSAKEFQTKGIIERITRILRETGLNPEYLSVEITESIVMRNLELMLPKITKLAEMGIDISIDDFGTGYSSLNYLKKLPIQTLKIDKTFVHDITISDEDEAIVGAVIAMAGKLKMKVIAEGVETAEQMAHLKTLGCNKMQGYLFSKPISAQEFGDLYRVSK